jgi:hypothetical protein
MTKSAPGLIEPDPSVTWSLGSTIGMKAHVVAAEGKPETAVINIMDALKESMEAKGRAKVRGAVRKRMGKAPEEARRPRAALTSTGARRTAH